MAAIVCPLCNNDNTDAIYEDRRREYYGCNRCELIFVPARFHLSASEEKGVYDLHQNSPDDERYRHFLSRLFRPVHERIAPASRGLDFGSGPGPTLSVMFAEAGHSMAIYDPFYAPDTKPLMQKYNFVTSSEVVEHLCDPAVGLNRMWGCVEPGGLLGVMTQMAENRDRFKTWHYKNDPTHVSFFGIATFEWMAEFWNADLTIVGNSVAVLTKTT